MTPASPASRAAAEANPRLSALPVALLLLLLSVFALLKAFGLGHAAGDENIYFYMAARTAEGLLPYRDFFFAHPPLHLLPGVLVAWLVGPSLVALKVIPMVAAGTAAVFVWRAARRSFGGLEALVAAAAFLFAYDLLRASSHFTGANLGVAFLAAGLDSVLARRDRAAGIFLAAAALSALYTAPVGAMLAVVRLAEDRRGGLDLVATGLLLFAAVNGVFIALAGGAYLDQVYAYHLAKPEAPSAFLGALAAVALNNPLLLWAPVPALVATVLDLRDEPLASERRRGRREVRTPLRTLRGLWARPQVRAVAVAGIPVLAGGLFLASLGRVYHFYFLLAFPGLALLAGRGYGALLRALAALARTLRACPRQASRPALAAALLLVAAVGADGVRAWGLRGQGWYPRDLGSRRAYVWRDAPLPRPVNALVRGLVWRDVREVGARVPGARAYLWHESRVFEGALRLAEAARRLDPQGGALFGDSTSAPLVALLDGRRLALDEADTNFMRFASGTTPPERFLARLDAAPPTLVLAHGRRGFYSVAPLRRWVESRYTVAARIQDPYQGTYLLFVRSPGP